jgi:hypothetical protein
MTATVAQEAAGRNPDRTQGPPHQAADHPSRYGSPSHRSGRRDPLRGSEVRGRPSTRDGHRTTSRVVPAGHRRFRKSDGRRSACRAGADRGNGHEGRRVTGGVTTERGEGHGAMGCGDGRHAAACHLADGAVGTATAVGASRRLDRSPHGGRVQAARGGAREPGAGRDRVRVGEPGRRDQDHLGSHQPDGRCPADGTVPRVARLDQDASPPFCPRLYHWVTGIATFRGNVLSRGETGWGSVPSARPCPRGYRYGIMSGAVLPIL